MTASVGPIRATGDLPERAAAWFAHMRGPDADKDRATFESWLAKDPLHREAYSRIAEVFSLGKGLSLATPATTAGPPVGRRRALAAVAATIVTLGVAGASLWTFTSSRLASEHSKTGASASGPVATRIAQYQTPVGQIRTIRMTDGSLVTLDTDTLLNVAFDASTRHLGLKRGRARFDVAHDGRPFVVAAGAGTITAHGTLFDVGIQSSGAVRVRLLRGTIDVALPDRDVRHIGKPAFERLAPGQQVVLAGHALVPAQMVRAPVDARWPNAELNGDHLALAIVAGEANRYSSVQIQFADPTLAALQVSGAFRIDDPAALADRLALLFDLHVDHAHPNRLTLRR